MSVSKVLSVAALACAAFAGAARGEPSEIRAAQQYGMSYLPLMIMEDSHLVARSSQPLGHGHQLHVARLPANVCEQLGHDRRQRLGATAL